VTHAFITVVIPFASARARSVNLALEALGNPTHAGITNALDQSEFVHFMSITVAEKQGETTTHLVLEASADGSARAACARLAKTLEPQILDVLRETGLTIPQDLGAFLETHRIDITPGWFSSSGAVFCGTPGMSVSRIKNEARFASFIGNWLAQNRNSQPALETLERARNAILENVDLKWACIADPVPLLGNKPALTKTLRSLLTSPVVYLLWPWLLPPLLSAVAQLLWGRSIAGAIRDACVAFGLEILLTLVGIWLVYQRLRRLEEADAPRDEEPSAADVEQIMARENRVMQNHLGGSSIVKPGFVRRLLLRVVFFAVGAVSMYASRPGFLSDIGTIHFARWIVLPGTDKLLFLSNYDGSWESYLEDFIARAHKALSAIWSNTQDFPRTKNLVTGGASDGERFKRWARRYQRPTRCWYSAYPSLKTSRIRTNAAIRHGFVSASTEEEAARWLNDLGFPAGAALSLESEDIPTLIFGGLSPLRHAHCLIVELAAQPNDCRGWLSAIAPRLSYGDREPGGSALVAGFSATGLKKLGLDESALATFPVAFQQGMTAPARSRALQDTDENAPEHWCWGGPGKACDAIVLVYARNPTALQTQVQSCIAELRRFGHRDLHHIALAPLPEKNNLIREPFGFVDGMSPHPRHEQGRRQTQCTAHPRAG
jgi:hypothetical protein